MCGCGRKVVTMRKMMQNKPVIVQIPVVKAPVVKTPVVNVPISIQRPKPKPQGKKLNNQRIALLNRIPPAMRKKLLR